MQIKATQIMAGREGRWWRRVLKTIAYPDGALGRQSRPTRAGYAYFVVTTLVMAAAFNTGNNMLFLVLGLMLAALLTSFMISEYMIANVHVRRDAPERVTAGTVFTVAYYVTNRKRITPSVAVRLRDRADGREVSALAVYVGAGEEVKVRGAGRIERRGRAAFNEILISTTAPFGLMRKQRRAKVPGQIIALPPADPGAIDRDELASSGDEIPRTRRGRGEELFGFREYRRGDPLKNVHWKTSARTGSLTVREQEAEEERRLRILLKVSPIATIVARPNDIVAKQNNEARETAVRRAASLGAAAIEEGWRVRVEVADKGIDFGSGPGQLDLILLFLALFDDPEHPAGETLPATDVPATIVE